LHVSELSPFWVVHHLAVIKTGGKHGALNGLNGCGQPLQKVLAHFMDARPDDLGQHVGVFGIPPRKGIFQN
jgi:hypothetical protein